MSKYILGIDQSTQGTKAILFDEFGRIVTRADAPHRQIINDLGWVEHDPEEIYANTIRASRKVLEKAGIDAGCVAAIGISNQRETSLVWDDEGRPLYNAIVWQDSRAEQLCEKLKSSDIAGKSLETAVKERTGIRLSPYFPAAKIAWILSNADGASEAAEAMRNNRGPARSIRMGTVDTWLVYRLTGCEEYRTDYSNASRTQLFNIHTLEWDSELCRAFGIDGKWLAEVTDSDGLFGETDLEGTLTHPVPIHAVMGDSHCALLAQGCLEPGMVKATYGTGSSVMMNIGKQPIRSGSGLVTSLAWKIDGNVNYVLEGNINYAGAVVTWLKDGIRIIDSASETESLSYEAAPEDTTILVPAFTGLGAPYWDSRATGMFCGMTRTTGRAELVRAAVDSIAYQITDILLAMSEDTGIEIRELRTDGGPTGNRYLMQFQSDMSRTAVNVSEVQELSAMGAAYAAGAAIGMYDLETVHKDVPRTVYYPVMDTQTAENRYGLWKNAVKRALR